MPRPSVRRRAVRIAPLAVLVALLLAWAPSAAAHTRVDRTSPAAGDTARTPVREVRVRFSAPVAAGLTRLTLVRGGETVAEGGAADPESGRREYVLPLGAPLHAGDYTVRWRTVGADGHVLEGSFGFTVAPEASPGVAPPADPAPASASAAAVPAAADAGHADDAGTVRSQAASPLAVAVRWAWFASLLGMIGVAAFRFAVLPRVDREPEFAAVARRAEYAAWYVALAAAALSAVSLLARLWLQAAALGLTGGGWNEAGVDRLITGTGWGLAWTLQAIATVAFAVGLAVARAPHGRGAGWMGAAAGAVLLAAVPALSGHAAGVEGPTWLAILSDTLHVLGAGVWLGTLAVLMAVGIPAALSDRARAGEAVAAMVRWFSPVALAGAAVAGATGIVAALFHLSAVPDLWQTGYGRALVLKLALLGATAALGYHHWRTVTPRLGDEPGALRFRRSARAEVALGAGVLLVTAVLVALPTP